MFRITSFLLLILCASLALAEQATQELRIEDTSGVVRATSEVAGNGNVQFKVEDALGSSPSGVAVTLKNSATGETLLATSSAGLVIFEAVAPGTWTVATSVVGVTFTEASVVSVSAALAGAGVAAAAAPSALALGSGTVVAGGVVAAGGATAIALSESNNNDDDTPPLSPSRRPIPVAPNYDLCGSSNVCAGT